MARNRSNSETSACPLTRIVGANEHGIIAISRSELEISSAFALGLHVSLPDSRQSEFVSAETMIVACQPEVDPHGNPVFRVALLFSDISWSDRDLLELMAYDEGLLSPRREPEIPAPDYSGPARLSEAIGKMSLN
jgi:hypothetical protein